jgi:proteasome lid subunit RPN8/RPN11
MEKEVLEQVQTERARLVKKRQTLLETFNKAALAGKPKRLSEMFIKICQTNEFLESLDQIDRKKKEQAAARRRYAVSSLFLHESFKKLTPGPEEEFFFITGNEVDGVFVLDQWAEFSHQKRSIVGVTADTRSTHKLLIKLEQFGHRLLGHFHSHPGNGPDSTNPSGIDENFQRRLESAGHVAVMAIFSRDGFVRFVRLDQNIEIEIYGEGVEQHAPGIFRLINVD